MAAILNGANSTSNQIPFVSTASSLHPVSLSFTCKPYHSFPRLIYFPTSYIPPFLAVSMPCSLCVLTSVPVHMVTAGLQPAAALQKPGLANTTFVSPVSVCVSDAVGEHEVDVTQLAL